MLSIIEMLTCPAFVRHFGAFILTLSVTTLMAVIVQHDAVSAICCGRPPRYLEHRVPAAARGYLRWPSEGISDEALRVGLGVVLVGLPMTS